MAIADKTLGSLGEFGLIDLIRQKFRVPHGTVGIGDDCAVIPSGTDDLLVTTDMLVEGIHFLGDKIAPEQLGYKSVAVNLSDIAAMGGEGVGTFLSIALPPSTPQQWAERFIEGYRAISDRYGVPLLGGDTTSSGNDIVVNVAVLGRLPHGKAKLRSAARLGDTVAVTGTLGDSGGGLRIILEERPHDKDAKFLLDRHLAPLPQMELGATLGGSEQVHAMMDISDGIASDLRHILSASGVGAVVDLEQLPLSEPLRRTASLYGWQAERIAASAGEDYELLFTIDPSAALPKGTTAIGRIVEGSGIEWRSGGRRLEDNIMGFRHF